MAEQRPDQTPENLKQGALFFDGEQADLHKSSDRLKSLEQVVAQREIFAASEHAMQAYDSEGISDTERGLNEILRAIKIGHLIAKQRSDTQNREDFTLAA